MQGESQIPQNASKPFRLHYPLQERLWLFLILTVPLSYLMIMQQDSFFSHNTELQDVRALFPVFLPCSHQHIPEKDPLALGPPACIPHQQDVLWCSGTLRGHTGCSAAWVCASPPKLRSSETLLGHKEKD